MKKGSSTRNFCVNILLLNYKKGDTFEASTGCRKNNNLICNII